MIYRGNSYQWKNHSGELDVFEAAGYFSGANESSGYVTDFNSGYHHNRNVKRLSLDMPKRNSVNHDQIPATEKQTNLENKKHKQPSSPGARIASFLNSLYQKSLKKKKTTKSGGMNDLEEEIHGSLRRKRRSSISHFPVTVNTKTATDSKSISGLTSCHLYSNTPLKSCKEFRIFADPFNPKTPLPKNSESLKPRAIRSGIPEKIILKNLSFELPDRRKLNVDQHPLPAFSDGAESDSSSDLFDLPNHDSDFCSSSDLPVYETTQLSKKISVVCRSGTAVV